MAYTGESHTSEGMPTSGYLDWCQKFYTVMGVYDTDAMREAKKRIAINEANKLLMTIKDNNTLDHIFLTISPPPNNIIRRF